MKVISADIQLSSQHKQWREHRIEERFTAVENTSAEEPPPNTQAGQATTSVNLSASQQIEKNALYKPLIDPSLRQKTSDLGSATPAYDDFFTLLVESFIGKKIAIKQFSENHQLSTNNSATITPPVEEASPVDVPPQRFDYYRHEQYFESETTSFKASGSITNEDGRVIEIDLQNTMHYQFSFEEEISLTNQTFIDPLTLNLGNSPASLTEQSYRFDLNADGNEETIRFVQGSSSFLALDKNEDGLINNGSELFGAISGNGFTELSVYDEDHNGFIDEADGVYHQLSLYNKNGVGENQFSTLKDAGVGAIYLGYTNTPFSIKDSNNETLAVVRTSGFYLSEEGETGAVQQIDLVV